MRILYHHRTRSTDAQRIHILEMVNAFKSCGHEVELASLVDTEAEQDNAHRDAENPAWQKLARRIPFAYDLVQLAYNLVGLPLLARRIFRKKPDLIYERYSLFNFAGVLAGKLFSRTVVVEVNSPFALEQQRDGDIRTVALANWAERTICNLATKVIVVSSPLRRILIQAGVNPEKIIVMPNGVSLDHFRIASNTTALRRSLPIGDRTVIGFVGWFRKWHGLEMLLEAFHKSGLAGGEAVLLMIGDGQAMPDLQAAVDQYGLRDSVIFTGPLPHEKIPAYVQLIDIAVQPAANEYCCPMKILEYMAVAKPIVAPRQENIEELLTAGQEAVFFEPNNVDSLSQALVSLARDPQARMRLGKAAFEAIEHRGYFWTKNAESVIGMVSVSAPSPGL